MRVVEAVMVGATVLDKQKVVHVVKAPCANKNNGYWYCVTHKECFQNQLEKDCHIHTGKHVLAWLCREHGFEQP